MILIIFSVIVFILFIILAIYRTLKRTEKITFVDIFLIFLGAISIAVAVLLNSLGNKTTGGSLDTDLSLAVGGIGIGVILFGIIVSIFEFLRRRHLRQSRGVMLLWVGVLTLLTVISVPFASAYFGLSSNIDQHSVSPTSNDDTITVEMVDGQRERLQLALNSLLQVLNRETGLGLDSILKSLDQGQTIAQLVEDNSGNVKNVIDDATAILIEQIQISLDRGEISRLDATSAIAFARIAVSLVVNNDIHTLVNMVNEENDLDLATNDPDRSFFEFLTTTATLPIQINVTSQLATSTPVKLATATLTPTASRTPRPTATPTNTRVLYQSPTPTVTPTLPSPCIAVMDFNVNLRAEPTLDAELITTIPYESVVNVFGRNRESTWWFIEYEGMSGWLSGEFIRLTTSCEFLPVRSTR